MADVTLTYKGNTIAEMSDTGTKTLKTAGKYCEGDIGVSYVNPSSGGTSDDLATMIITGGGSGFVELPSDVTAIRNYAFMDCDSCCLESLPEGLTYIGIDAFSGCRNLRITSIPSTVETIRDAAFYGCNLLTTITFKGTPRNIAGNAFTDCTRLTTINVPWAEGAVANAPWGANNATINYNYTE